MPILATPRGGVHSNRTRKIAHTAIVVAAEIIVNNGQVVVACNASDADAENAFIFTGPVEMPKKAGLAIAAGDDVYFDADPGEITKTEADGVRAGICLEAAAAADTVVLVELIPNQSLPTHAHA